MATRVGTEDNPVEMLEHLMALDLDAIEAYDAAIDGLDNNEWKAALATFRQDHSRHVQELGPLIRDLGGTPPTKPDAKAMLAEGKVKIANLMGDEAVLKAMRSNEDDTNTAYERALAKCPMEAQDVVSRGLDDEHRHREWIVATLEGRPVRAPRSSAGMGRDLPPV